MTKLASAPVPGPVSTENLKMRQAIRRTLRQYASPEHPLTISMIGVHIRPYRRWWSDVFEEMVSSGEIIREMRDRETATGHRKTLVHYLAH